MDSSQQLHELKANLERLLRNFTAVKNENDMFRQQIDAQRRALAEKNNKIHELEEQLTLAKTSKLITDADVISNEDKSDVKQKINELIKEVDKCIGMLE